jgi:hypothetical protein
MVPQGTGLFLDPEPSVQRDVHQSMVTDAIFSTSHPEPGNRAVTGIRDDGKRSQIKAKLASAMFSPKRLALPMATKCPPNDALA